MFNYFFYITSILYRKQLVDQFWVFVALTHQHIYTACCLEQKLCNGAKSLITCPLQSCQNVKRKGRLLISFVQANSSLAEGKYCFGSELGKPSTKSQTSVILLEGSPWMVCSELLLLWQWWLCVVASSHRSQFLISRKS